MRAKDTTPDLFAPQPHQFTELKEVEIKSPHEGNYKYSEEWRHLCEVRELERMYFYDQAYYFAHMKLIAQKRSPTIAYDLDKQVRANSNI